MSIRHRWRLFACAALIGLGSNGGAWSFASVRRIDQPVPSDLSARTADIIRKLRPHDFEDALKSTKLAMLSVDHRHIVLRIEANCPDGLCMTVLGRLTDQEIVPELTMVAGQLFLVSDAALQIWDFDAAPLLTFEGLAGAGLVAIHRQQGWILTACRGCTDWTIYGRAEVKSAEPAAQPAPIVIDSFEEFTRKLHATIDRERR